MKPLQLRRDAILARARPDALVVEVGVLIGRLSAALLAARPDIRLVMVDNWLSAEHQPEEYLATRDTAALADRRRVAAHRREAMQRVEPFGDRVQVIEDASVSAATLFEDGSCDLVFLDADHSERGVRNDIAAWWPKVRPSGWLGGHDYGNGDPRYDFSGVARAVDARFPEVDVDRNFTWWVRK